MNASSPKVSFIVRSMDRPTLARALNSIAVQRFNDIEIIVVAACGLRHRPLPAAFGGVPLRLIIADDGVPLARAGAANLGLEAARGEWINFLDDDDELLPNHLETLLHAARSADERLLYSCTRVHDDGGNFLGLISHPGNHVQLYFHSRSTTCATLIHRSLIDEGARFDPDFEVHEDHDFFVNCATRTQFRFVDASTCIWHASAGESGCGFGTNDDTAQRTRSLLKIRAKWQAVFATWLQDIDAVLFTGQQYLKGGDYPVALMCLEFALEARPDDVNALNLAGMANFRAGNLERAQRLLAQALALLPEHAGLRDNLERVRRAAVQGGYNA